MKFRSKWQLSPMDSYIGQAIYYSITYAMHVSLPKRPIQLVQQSKQQALRGLHPNI
jgi:hypothetical protein